MTDPASLVDFIGSLAVLGMLSVAYGTIRRALGPSGHASAVLGIVFGVAAAIQMNAPISPFPGIIIDLRFVVITLAGAFIGVRGTVVCIAIAAAVRFNIGGVGAASGVAGMIIAGLAGSAWRAWVPRDGRTKLSLVLLAPLCSLHLLAVVLLPYDLAIWFLGHAAPLLLGMYVLTVPLIASLLERERVRLADEHRIRAESVANIDGALMPRDALAWALAQAGATGALRGAVDCLTVRLRHEGVLSQMLDDDTQRLSMAAMGQTLTALLPQGGVVGWAGPGVALLAVPAMSDDRLADLETAIRRELVGLSVPSVARIGLRLSIGIASKRHEALPALAVLMPPPARPRRRAPGIRKASVSSSKPIVPVETPADQGSLFTTFDRLHEARFGSI